MNLSTIFKTKISRSIFLLILILPAAGIFFEYKSSIIVSPAEQYYFYTILDTSVDPSSPNKKRIIEEDIKNLKVKYFGETYIQRCDSNVLSDRGVSTMGAEYRGIELCNSANVTGEDFDIRNKYFKQKVDRLWGGYYLEHLTVIITGIVNGVVVWLCLFGLVLSYRWIMRADETDAKAK